MRIRSLSGLCGAVALVLLAAAALAQAVVTYRGAWFEVEYPADFTAADSLPSPTAEGADSATFSAPDGSVSFYVYAPRWGGTPTDIALDPATEQLASERTATSGTVTQHWFTIAARDGSYRRSYLTTSDDRGPTTRTIGLRYTSAEALSQHHVEYRAFRDSLKQFAD